MKSLLLMFLLLLLGRCGTEQGYKKTFVYSIRNETGHSMKVISYLRSSDLIHEFTVENNQDISKKFRQDLGEQYNFHDFFGKGFHRADSIKIIYNNNRYSIFKGECSQNKKNPLNFCIYNKTKETYIFSPEDYQNATPCNGNCY